MRIFIELPTWLGDCVMATPAIESIVQKHKNARFVFFGSFVSTQLLKTHKNCEFVVVDESKKAKFRLFYLYKMAKNLGQFDLAISFRSSFYSKILVKMLSKNSFKFKNRQEQKHQVLKYLDFIKLALKIDETCDNLKLNFTPKPLKNAIGLNPGATYGSAKRWYPEYFANVAMSLGEREIFIFGGQNESEICAKIAEILSQNGVKFTNLCGQTGIKELCEYIGGLGLFITNDSGPMHIAAAFKVPTIALFGPTKWAETSPWGNTNARILRLNLACMPCMKRVCPLKTHECMKNLTPKMVLDEIQNCGF